MGLFLDDSLRCPWPIVRKEPAGRASFRLEAGMAWTWLLLASSGEGAAPSWPESLPIAGGALGCGLLAWLAFGASMRPLYKRVVRGWSTLSSFEISSRGMPT